MNIISDSNKNLLSSKQIVPTVTGALIALAIVLPATAVFGGQPASAGATPVALSCVVPATQTAGSSVTNAKSATTGHASHSKTVTTTTSTGSTNSGNGNTNSNGSAQANGNSQTNVGGLVGGVNAIVPVSALNNDLNDVASHNTVLSGNALGVSVLSGNTASNQQSLVASVPVVADLLSNLGVKL